MNAEELENRLISFAVQVLKLLKYNSMDHTGLHLSKQISRSGTSPALNYAEARSAESDRDFLHKLKLVLKELRETHVCLRIIGNAELNRNTNKLAEVLQECDELVSIFTKSVKTNEQKMVRKKLRNI